MKYEPKPGHYLHASCSDTDLYEVVGSGQDANGHSTLDVRVLNLNEILHFGHDGDAQGDGSDGKWLAPLTVAELPAGVHVVLRGLQWRGASAGDDDVERVEVNAPQGGCYRCCYLFSVRGARELIKWMADRRQRETDLLVRRIAYGGKKGRAACRRLRRMGGSANIWKPTERVIGCLFGPHWAQPPYGFARESGARPSR